MRPVIALLILGSIVTSASAAGTDIRGLVDAQTGHTVISEQQSTTRRTAMMQLLALPILRPRRCQLRSLVTRRSLWNKLNSSNPV